MHVQTIQKLEQPDSLLVLVLIHFVFVVLLVHALLLLKTRGQSCFLTDL